MQKQKSLKVNAALNIISQSCKILFPLITYPYISRALGNAAYGRYGFADTFVNYFLLFAGLGISTYSIREGSKIRDDRQKINNFADQVFTINVISTALSYAALTACIIISAKVRSYGDLILIRSLIILLTTLGADWINNIYEDFGYLTIRYIIIQIVSLVLMLTLVRKPEDVVTYTWIMVLSTAGGYLLNIFYIRRYIHLRITFHPNIRRHLKPLLILFANTMAITIYVSSDITMLGFMRTDAEVGVYSLASKIYNLLKMLINAAITVMIPRLAYVVNDREKYESYIRKAMSAMALLIVPMTVGLICLSKQVMLIVGGSQYESGAAALAVLSLAMVWAIGGSVFSSCILIINKQEQKVFKATCAAAVLNVGLNFILIPILGMTGAAITTVLAEATACILEGHWAKKILSLTVSDIDGLKGIIVGGIAVLIICVASVLLLHSILLIVVTAVVLSVIVYGLINIHNSLVMDILHKINR